VRFVSVTLSKCGSSESMRAWFSMAVAAIMQSPMGTFLYLLLRMPAFLAIAGVKS